MTSTWPVTSRGPRCQFKLAPCESPSPRTFLHDQGKLECSHRCWPCMHPRPMMRGRQQLKKILTICGFEITFLRVLEGERTTQRFPRTSQCPYYTEDGFTFLRLFGTTANEHRRKTMKHKCRCSHSYGPFSCGGLRWRPRSKERGANGAVPAKAVGLHDLGKTFSHANTTLTSVSLVLQERFLFPASASPAGALRR